MNTEDGTYTKYNNKNNLILYNIQFCIICFLIDDFRIGIEIQIKL